MKKKVFAAIALVLCLFLFAGCGEKGIQGTWVLYEEFESDGTKITRKELDENGVNEIYVIEGDTVHYKCSLPGAKKDIEIDMTLIDKGDNRYEFKIGDRVTFASPEVSGNKLIYYVGEGSDTMKMVFKRSK